LSYRFSNNQFFFSYIDDYYLTPEQFQHLLKHPQPFQPHHDTALFLLLILHHPFCKIPLVGKFYLVIRYSFYIQVNRW